MLLLKEQGLDLANVISCVRLALWDSLPLPWMLSETIYGSIGFAEGIILGYKSHSANYFAFSV